MIWTVFNRMVTESEIFFKFINIVNPVFKTVKSLTQTSAVTMNTLIRSENESLKIFSITSFISSVCV